MTHYADTPDFDAWTDALRDLHRPAPEPYLWYAPRTQNQPALPPTVYAALPADDPTAAQQIEALNHLRYHPGCNSTQIAAVLCTTPATAGAVLWRLRRAGRVTRTGSSRRYAYYAIEREEPDVTD